jgi:hypothetical protein
MERYFGVPALLVKPIDQLVPALVLGLDQTIQRLPPEREQEILRRRSGNGTARDGSKQVENRAERGAVSQESRGFRSHAPLFLCDGIECGKNSHFIRSGTESIGENYGVQLKFHGMAFRPSRMHSAGSAGKTSKEARRPGLDGKDIGVVAEDTVGGDEAFRAGEKWVKLHASRVGGFELQLRERTQAVHSMPRGTSQVVDPFPQKGHGEGRLSTLVQDHGHFGARVTRISTERRGRERYLVFELLEPGILGRDERHPDFRQTAIDHATTPGPFSVFN